MVTKVNKVVLAYSGGLDTSVIIKWLIENYGCEVIAFIADLGQGEDLESIKKKALATGATKAYVYDLREEFVRDFVFPMLKANAIYEGGYLLGTSIARPIIAKAQMDVVKKEGAEAVAHGSTGKGNDQVRFELTYYVHNPHIKIISPWREWDFKSRSDLIEYAKSQDIPITVTKAKPYSVDRNLLHVSSEGGVLEDPWVEAPEDVYLTTTSPQAAPDSPTYVEIDFEQGTPVAVNGNDLTPAELLTELNRLGAENGVGRDDIVENRYVGMKSRGIYETPGGTILHVAKKGIESITMDREVMHLRDSLIPQYAEIVYYGYWFSPEREFLQKSMDEAQKDVTGKVKVKLFKGSCTVAGRKSPNSLYSQDFATFEDE
ncbi:MAG: argininosuccinate synthase, partial [Thermodesulfobacteriota bacterium]